MPGTDDSRSSINLYCDLIHQTIDSSKQEIVFEEKKEIKDDEQNSVVEANNSEKVEVKNPSTPVEPE